MDSPDVYVRAAQHVILTSMPTLTVKPSDCAGAIHPAAIKGMQLFDQGEYWLAHEALEEAWKEESGPVRELYRAILQAGVVYLHIERDNYIGAIKVYAKVQKWIQPWPDVCRGIEIGALRRDLDIVIAEVRRLGPERLAEFDRSLFKPVRWT
jgi:predicted metal-dependent hydrolase